MITFRKAWKKFWNPILKHSIVQWIIVSMMAIVIWVVYYTSKKTVVGKSVLREYKNKSAIFVFWHGRTMMLSVFVRKYGFKGYAVASRHKDGRMMAKLQRLFGLKSILGSTTSGSLQVLMKGVRVLRNEKCVVCISPDGPSGPSLRMKDGALYFAKMTGVPIIPVCFCSTRPWFQNRWDRYLISKPFSKIKYVFGKPIFVDSKASDKEFEKIRKNIEDVLIKQNRDLDKEFTKFEIEQDLMSGPFKDAKRRKKRLKKAIKKK